MDIGILLDSARALMLVAAFAAFGWSLLRMRRENAEQAERAHQAQRELAAQIHTLSERTSALATLVASLPRQAERGAEAPQSRPRREMAPVRSYESARRLARSGASIEEIVASSGLATSEARLLRRLHSDDPGHGNVA